MSVWHMSFVLALNIMSIDYGQVFMLWSISHLIYVVSEEYWVCSLIFIGVHVSLPHVFCL